MKRYVAWIHNGRGWQVSVLADAGAIGALVELMAEAGAERIVVGMAERENDAPE